MPYHAKLLEHAQGLVRKDQPTQADLRRAISAAYYALFHLLISETVRNWSRDSTRDALERLFDHGAMKKASSRVLGSSSVKGDSESEAIRIVAQAFVQLQEKRHIADYDNTKSWTAAEALVEVATAIKAFAIWPMIRDNSIAQEYLVSLLRRRD